MKKSRNEHVQKFLGEIADRDDEKTSVLLRARKIVFDICPEASERIMYGGIMFAAEEDFGGLFMRKNHVSFEFGRGNEFDDPNKQLEGTGKSRRHLKLKTTAEIKSQQVEFFVNQAIDRNACPPFIL